MAHHDLEHQLDMAPNASALSVSRGGEPVPPGVSPKRGVRRRQLSIDELESGVVAGDRAVLGRAITLIESTNHQQQAKGRELLERLMPKTGASVRVGVTGVPGVGKSTFIERFGRDLTESGRKVAVLAVDPSSGVSGGSILGDKTRMAQLAADPAAFIRPSPSAGTLGGVASKTRETMLVCEAAGYDVVLIETVGVGQSETVVAGMTDFFLGLMLPGAGDELQGIKRGLLELVELIAVNKADGDNATRARRAVAEYQAAVRMTRGHDGWIPPIIACSGLSGMGLKEIWSQIEGRVESLRDTGELADRRRRQALRWMWSIVDERLRLALRDDEGVAALLAEVEAGVLAGDLPATAAAERVLSSFLSKVR